MCSDSNCNGEAKLPAPVNANSDSIEGFQRIVDVRQGCITGLLAFSTGASPRHSLIVE